MLKRIFLGALVLIVAAVAVILVAFLKLDIPRAALEAKYTNAASQFITLDDGTRVHVRDQGNTGGPAIVLVHGSNASLHTWEPWAAQLGDRFRVVTMDMPGHGLTGRTPVDDYSPMGMVAVVKGVTRKMGIDHFVLGGNSMGGGVALRYALTRESDLDGLILVDASGLPPRADEVGTGKAARSFSLVRMPVVGWLLRWITPRFVFRDALEGVFVDQSLVTDEMVDRYFELNVMEGTRDATRTRFSTPRADADEDAVAALEVPTLILWGDKDRLIPVSVAHRFDALIPNSTLVIYENVGHIPMEEVAVRSAADVRAFVDGLAAASADAADGEMPVPANEPPQVVVDVAVH
jgi:pimeloyl-ACP methyl ester carboxylesterase